MGVDLDYIVEGLRPLAVEIDSVHLDPANARTGHAVDRIAASLQQYKQRKPIVVNRGEGNKIEAGNGTWQGAKQLGWTHIAAVFVDDDPMTAVGYAIVDNRLPELSSWDGTVLKHLLEGLDPDLELETGFGDGDLDELLARLETAAKDSGSGGAANGIDPSLIPGEDRYREQYGVIIICEDAAEQESVYESMVEAGYSCRVVVT